MEGRNFCLKKTIMLKKDIRKQYNAKRLALTERDIARWDDLLLIRFQQLPVDVPVQTLSTYLALPHKNEFDTQHIVRYLEFVNPGMRITIPRITDRGFDMEHFLMDDDTVFVLNKYGIAEPENAPRIDVEEIDMVLVPLLAFDLNGNRVGYGKGYYDRFLSKCRPDTVSIGFSYFDPINRIEDADGFDVPLNFCITPDAVYEF